MPRFAANLSMLYPELTFPDRLRGRRRRIQGGRMSVSV